MKRRNWTWIHQVEYGIIGSENVKREIWKRRDINTTWLLFLGSTQKGLKERDKT